MSKIRIDFLLGKDWSSKLIAWYGNGYGGWSHAASLLQSGMYVDSRADTIAGVPPGVRVRNPRSEKWSKRMRATLEVDEHTYVKWETSLLNRIGEPYAKIAIWEFITGKNETVDGMWICSALAINALQHAKIIPFPLWVPAHQITPNTLLTVCQVAGFRITDEDNVFMN